MFLKDRPIPDEVDNFVENESCEYCGCKPTDLYVLENHFCNDSCMLEWIKGTSYYEVKND